MKQLVISEAARRDLIDIGDHIAEDNPERSITFVDELEAKAGKAGERPSSFPAREDLGPGVRSALHRSYNIFFREGPEEVRILRILHGARDFSRIDFS